VSAEKIVHGCVTEARLNRGWAVSVVENGQNTISAVFHDEERAHTFSDSERRRLGLKLLHREADGPR
jgi:hypothetical protein